MKKLVLSLLAVASVGCATARPSSYSNSPLPEGPNETTQAEQPKNSIEYLPSEAPMLAPRELSEAERKEIWKELEEEYRTVGQEEIIRAQYEKIKALEAKLVCIRERELRGERIFPCYHL